MPRRCISSEPPHGRPFAGVGIALDPYPYNGVTTTCESLYAGVPVISPHGGNSVARSGLSLLGSLGLGELAAATAESYVDTRFEELLRTAWQLSG